MHYVYTVESACSTRQLQSSDLPWRRYPPSLTNQLTHAHQLDVELVQMAIELVIARVPPEMWVAIARAGPGEMAFAMERVCQTWRRALISAGDTLWKPLTLARFPRVVGILRASLTDPPPYREMYRDQAKAEAAPAWLKGEPLPSLDEFVFSIEMEQAAVQQTGSIPIPATTHTWQGTMQFARAIDGLEVSAAAALGGAELRPSGGDGAKALRAWLRAYRGNAAAAALQAGGGAGGGAGAENRRRELEALRATLTMRVFVTRRHYTLRLYDPSTPFYEEAPTTSAPRRAAWQRRALTMPFARMRGLLDPDFEPSLQPKVMMPVDDDEAGEAGEAGEGSGEGELVLPVWLEFCCRADGTLMNTEEITDYLYFCLPWPQ